MDGKTRDNQRSHRKNDRHDRNDHGPDPGDGHWYYEPGEGWTWSILQREPDGGATGYDTMGYRGNAKNILIVGGGGIALGGLIYVVATLVLGSREVRALWQIASRR